MKTEDTKVTGDQLLTLKDVQKRVQWSRATIYRHMADGTFPKPRHLSSGSIRWEQNTIERWIEVGAEGWGKQLQAKA
ncbi:AlpA family phage regulatory protein [Gluconobacter cerinus]|uniref:helix-turn-helix transcriptional regulator n=1 Tax=Gluconobacter cerinus TaxID=38307 RepID=UPI001B8C5149|nr:AlpA family phage regulatory protein [Gluconobacter cerinus]MBS1041424.1 AlpA family phage regulatory protein [Gluconobacter cerinus]MBS1048012.1 AlpA family phage regulatory protein [Gluconobacter cerinus]